jgi:hypothetical protein
MTAVLPPPCAVAGVVLIAARWRASQKRPPAAVLSFLQERFSLSVDDAEQVIKEARLIHARAH